MTIAAFGSLPIPISFEKAMIGKKPRRSDNRSNAKEYD
jgi:hypothetical protein